MFLSSIRLASLVGLFYVTRMTDPGTLSKQQLLDLIQNQSKELAQSKDIVRQLEAKLDQQQKDYLKLWKELSRPGASVTSPIRTSCESTGDTPESSDAADGLADAAEDADLIASRKRRKPKKKDHSFPAHFPRTIEVIDVDEAEKTCPDHGEKQLLPESMWDVREKLVMVPAKFEVEVRIHNRAAVGLLQANVTDRSNHRLRRHRFDVAVSESAA